MTDRKAMLWLAAAFVLSRIAYALAGIHFDATPVEHYWQMIDPVLMRTDLARSLWYLHMQPPAYNLFVGLIVSWFPESYTAVFHLLHLVMGVVILWGAWRLLRLFDVPNGWAVLFTTCFMVSPSMILYENLLSYEYPVLLLLELSALALYRMVERPSTKAALTFFSLIGTLMLIRNMFHLIYLVGLAAALWWMLPALRRHVAIGVLPALAINTALYVKNWFLFGVFAASTWTGMLAGVLTTAHMTPAEIEQEIALGHLPPIARVPGYSWLKDYEPYVQMPPPSGIAVLDEAVTSTGHPNFNHQGYLRISYASFLPATLRYMPKAYAQSVAIAWFTYFLPATDVHTLDVNRRPIETWDRIWSGVFYGQFFRAATRKDLRALKASGEGWKLPFYTGLFFLVAVVAMHAWAGLRLWRQWKGTGLMSRAQTVTWCFLWSTLLFITAISNFLSSFECNRYRFPVDGYYLVLLATLVMAVLPRGSAPAAGDSRSVDPRGSAR